MFKKKYDWKRYWCPQSSQSRLDAHGYLVDPDTEWGKSCNPTLVDLQALAKVQCLVLLGEPGSGKSTELKNLKSFTEEQVDDSSKQVLDLNLRSSQNLRQDLFQDRVFIDWLESDYDLYLFLDSLDESLYNPSNIAQTLVDELARNRYHTHLNRLYIRLVGRIFVFPTLLEDGLRELWQEDNFAIYKLAPLRRSDIIQAAKVKGLSTTFFLRDLEEKKLVPLSTHPITLDFLLSKYSNNDEFLQDLDLCDLYHDGCEQLCCETNESYLINKKGDLDSFQRLIIASRIAAVTIFTNQSALWTGVLKADKVAEDLDFRELLYKGKEESNDKEFEIIQAGLEEVLNTGLFTSNSKDRFDWVHQSHAEFLAAWYLIQHQVSTQQIKALIFFEEGTQKRLIPQLSETAIWIARMNGDVLNAVVEVDPDILVRSDCLLKSDDEFKKTLVNSLLEQYELDNIAYDYYKLAEFQYLAHPDILDQIKPYLLDSNKNIQARHVAIDLSERCKLHDASQILIEIALDPEEIYFIRTRAAKFIANVGRDIDKEKLKALYLEKQDDPSDELKGYALRAIYPKFLTTEKFLNSLKSTRANYFGGCYQDFLANQFIDLLPNEDLLLALRWLQKQPFESYTNYLFDTFERGIYLKAWENFDSPEILSTFAQLLVTKESNHIRIFDNNESDNIIFEKMLDQDDFKRRILLEEVVEIIQNTDKNPFWLIRDSHYTTLTPLEKDFTWLLKKLKASTNENKKEVYSKLINYKLDWTNCTQVSLIITTSEIESTLRKQFSSYLEPIPLNSEQANKLRAEYDSMKKYWRRTEPQTLEPPPKIRIQQCLNEFESGRLDFWPQLCCELTLLPTSTNYNQIYRADITLFPGWQEAEQATKVRIINAAKTYIYEGEPSTETWLGTNSLPQLATNGYQALSLLTKLDTEFISTLPSKVWCKWASTVIGLPNYIENGNFEIKNKLLQKTYLEAPDEFFRVLDFLMDQENLHPSGTDAHEKLMCCWDNKLEKFLLAKLKDETLTAASIGNLLKTLLDCQIPEASIVAKSLIVFPLPENKERQEIISVAAKKLLIYSPNTAWESVWKIIQECPEFGKEVFESVSYSVKHNGSLEKHLDAKYIADLYIFITQHYYNDSAPASEEEEIERLTGPKTRCIGPADSVRMWRERIPQRLQELGTPEACQALEKIIEKFPKLGNQLRWRLAEARSITRHKNWQPLTPKSFLQFIANKDQRLVQSGQHLLKVLVESLERLEMKLQGETPAARDLWDKQGSSSFRPLDENAFSDYVKRFLVQDLKERGIIVNREVEIRRSHGGNPGERTDIHVNAVIKNSQGQDYDSITVIIEVKGCWHSELKKAMQTQLLERYIADNTCQHGLYLVGWFNCQQWDNDDSRKRKAFKVTYDEAKQTLDNQAKKLSSSSAVLIQAFILKTSLR